MMDLKYINQFFSCVLLVLVCKLPVFVLGFIPHPDIMNDASQYRSLANLSLTDWNFFILRPFGYPLFIKLLFTKFQHVVIAQFLIATFSWAFVVFYIRISKLDRQYKILLIVAVGLIVSSVPVVNWDNKMLTESLSLSSLCVAMSMVYTFYMYGSSWSGTILFVLSITIFIALRDSNYLLAIYLMFFIGYCKNVKMSCRVVMVLCIVIMSVFIIYTSQQGGRQKINMKDNLAGYIYANDTCYYKKLFAGFSNYDQHDYYKWYTEHTVMPQLKNQFDACVLKKNTNIALTDFEKSEIVFRCFPSGNTKMQNYIASSHLAKDYTRFVLAHPLFALFDYGEHLPQTRFLTIGISTYVTYNGNSILSKHSMNPLVLLSTICYSVVTVGLVGLFMFGLLSNRVMGRNWASIYIATMFIPAWIFAALNFIGDPMELGRHVLAGGWYILIGGLYLLLLSLSMNGSQNRRHNHI